MKWPSFSDPDVRRQLMLAGVGVLGGATVLGGAMFLVRRQAKSGDLVRVRLIHDLDPDTKRIFDAYLPTIQRISEKGVDVRLRLGQKGGPGHPETEQELSIVPSSAPVSTGYDSFRIGDLPMSHVLDVFGADLMGAVLPDLDLPASRRAMDEDDDDDLDEQIEQALGGDDDEDDDDLDLEDDDDDDDDGDFGLDDLGDDDMGQWSSSTGPHGFTRVTGPAGKTRVFGPAGHLRRVVAPSGATRSFSPSGQMTSRTFGEDEMGGRRTGVDKGLPGYARDRRAAGLPTSKDLRAAQVAHTYGQDFLGDDMYGEDEMGLLQQVLHPLESLKIKKGPSKAQRDIIRAMVSMDEKKLIAYAKNPLKSHFIRKAAGQELQRRQSGGAAVPAGAPVSPSIMNWHAQGPAFAPSAPLTAPPAASLPRADRGLPGYAWQRRQAGLPTMRDVRAARAPTAPMPAAAPSAAPSFMRPTPVMPTMARPGVATRAPTGDWRTVSRPTGVTRTYGPQGNLRTATGPAGNVRTFTPGGRRLGEDEFGAEDVGSTNVLGFLYEHPWQSLLATTVVFGVGAAVGQDRIMDAAKRLIPGR